MRIDDMITAVQLDAKLNAADDDYPAARIRQELTDCLKQVFGTLITKARAGAWLKQTDVEVEAGKYRYRIPARAFSSESVEIVASAGSYELIGDQVVFVTQPPTGAFVRFTYYASPSLLTQEQTAGLITTHDDVAGTITFATLPVNRVTLASLAVGDRVDIVHSNGWHELSLIGATVQALSGAGPYVMTFGSDVDLSDVENGIDYVRAAEQTDWPCLQSDFHRTLCTLTAARILRFGRGDLQKATQLEAQCGIVIGQDHAAPYTGDIARFIDSLEPRVKDAPRVAVPRGTLLRRGRRLRNSATTFG